MFKNVETREKMITDAFFKKGKNLSLDFLDLKEKE